MRGLVRTGSERKLPAGVVAVSGNPLESASFVKSIPPAETYVHLIGVAHPAPWKEQEFRAVDLASLRASVEAATSAGIKHFVYVSVAQPAPVMKAYIRVRAEGEAILRASGMTATILRPWYVLGPGRRWPLALKPFYWLAERLESSREGALRLGLVTIEQMTSALVWAVENPPERERVMEVRQINACGKELLR